MGLPAYSYGDEDRRDETARLWLSDRQWMAILEQVERQAQDTELDGDDQRNAPRLTAPAKTQCLIRLGHPSPVHGTYLVKLRNVSATGLGFLCTDLFESGARCTVAIKNDCGRGLVSGASIIWCRPIGEGLNEVGVRFDHPINTGGLFPDASPDPTEDPPGGLTA
jgi:PilZ domain